MITNDIYGALQLLIVGMLTVFAVLLIVINLGKLLIWAVNKWEGGSRSEGNRQHRRNHKGYHRRHHQPNHWRQGTGVQNH